MAIPQNLGDQSTNRVLAELWSNDRRHVFRISIHGYERSDEEWLVADIEYQTRSTLCRILKWEFNTRSLASAAHLVKRVNGCREVEQTLLHAPYQHEYMILGYKKGYIKKAWQPFLKDREGLFVHGKFGNFEFQFKVNKLELLRFSKALEEATRMFPAITRSSTA